jgi:hypothetical protein
MGMDLGDGAEEFLGIGVGGVVKYVAGFSSLYNFAVFHYTNLIADMPYYRKVVSDKYVAQASFFL